MALSLSAAGCEEGQGPVTALWHHGGDGRQAGWNTLCGASDSPVLRRDSSLALLAPSRAWTCRGRRSSLPALAALVYLFGGHGGSSWLLRNPASLSGDQTVPQAARPTARSCWAQPRAAAGCLGARRDWPAPLTSHARSWREAAGSLVCWRPRPDAGASLPTEVLVNLPLLGGELSRP